MTGVELGTGVCYAGHTFSFDPAAVPCIAIDPATGLPPDIAADGTPVEPAPEAVARTVQRPFCPRHARQFNEARRAAGYGPPFMTEVDTAAELTRRSSGG